VSKGAQRRVMVFRCCRPDAIAGCLRKATRWAGDTGEIRL
jgi:hypothetical protein